VDCDGEFLRCFVTNNETNAERYHSLDPHFRRSSVNWFTLAALFFWNRGQCAS
jgi:hypothetical protein